MYMSHLRPLLLRHQARLDQIVNFLYREMVRICAISYHGGRNGLYLHLSCYLIANSDLSSYR